MRSRAAARQPPLPATGDVSARAPDRFARRRGSRTLGEMAELQPLERGDLWFVATPRVRARNVLTLRPQPPHPREVQRLYLLLRADGRPVHRRLLVGRNRLPQSPRHRFWACIERVGDAWEVTDDLGRIEYDTQTRGPRVRPPAR